MTDKTNSIEYHGIRPGDPAGRNGLRNPERGWRLETVIAEEAGADRAIRQLWTGYAAHLEGRIFEVETPDVLAAVDSLAGAEQVLDAAVFGRALHVRLRQGVEARDFLFSHLSSAGLVVNQFKAIEPTLEDVFAALVGRSRGEEP